MTSTKDYPEAFIKPLELAFQTLNNCNIRVFEEHVTLIKKLRTLFLILCLTLHYASLALFIVQVLNGVKRTVDLAFNLPSFLTTTQVTLKIVIIFLNKKEIRSIVNKLGTMWKTDLTEVKKNRQKSLNRKLELCQKILYYAALMGTWLYSITPFADVILRRFFLQQNSELRMPYPCSYPFDPATNWIVYIGIYMFQVYCMFRFIYVYMGSELLIMALCSHMVTEFSLLREDLVHMKPVLNDGAKIESNEDNSFINLKHIIKKHQKLTTLCMDLDHIFNKINFISFLCATIIICCLAFSAQVAHGMVMMANYFVVFIMMVPMFIMCYYGELLRTESVSVADSAYDNLWYDGGPSYQKAILFIIMRAQKPCCLTTMKYAPITLNTFSKVLSTTWSYFSLVRSAYEEVN